MELGKDRRIGLIKNDEKRMSQYDEILEELKPFLVLENNKEYAGLLKEKEKRLRRMDI
jgi:hypothetical protein